jgi:hypothetical protein
MAMQHPGFMSFYVRVGYNEDTGFSFDPHCLDVPFDVLATITWFTEDPNLKFTGFNWCGSHEHHTQQPLIRGNCMIGAVHTDVSAGDTYWRYQVEAEVKAKGGSRHCESMPCTALTDGLPRIHPK